MLSFFFLFYAFSVERDSTPGTLGRPGDMLPPPVYGDEPALHSQFTEALIEAEGSAPR